MDLEREIRSFIEENFLYGESGGALEAEASLLESGVMDSTGVLELVTHLEAAYGIVVRDDELLPENLDSIRNLVEFVGRKRGLPAVEG
ncbi:D-alanine--poly(phosphoribitol) ligase subunit 2 [Burkholderiales bacterium]|jgi:acyl carrier protein|nr:D-alanine--poly(phosphoribitol) ligase subunit 2 [Burkholderiales bacterium]